MCVPASPPCVQLARASASAAMSTAPRRRVAGRFDACAIAVGNVFMASGTSLVVSGGGRASGRRRVLLGRLVQVVLLHEVVEGGSGDAEQLRRLRDVAARDRKHA